MMEKSIILLVLHILTTLVSVVQSSINIESVNLRGENVYTVDYNGMQYFLFIADEEAIITCTVSGTSTVPDITFKKEGKLLDEILKGTDGEKLYTLDRESSGQSHSLKLRIDSRGYTDIVGNWTCEVSDSSSSNPIIKRFNTLFTNKPDITFDPPLVQGVARQGTTITMRCNCDALDDLTELREFNWFVDQQTPWGNNVRYLDERNLESETGEPTDRLEVSDLDVHQDSASYKCACLIGYKVQLSSQEVQMAVMKPPKIPKDIVLESATMNSLSITWKNSDDMGIVLGYKISYKTDSDSKYRVVSSEASDTNYILRDLDPLTSYTIKIAASNNAGGGANSNVVTFQTLRPSESVPKIQRPRDMVHKIEDDMYLVNVGQGVDTVLPCEVDSYPSAVVEWEFNGRKLETDPAKDLPQNYERSNEVKTRFKTEHILYIKSSSTANSGKYTCTATNTKGKDTLKFNVKVTADDKEGEAEHNTNSDQSLSFLPCLYLVLVTLFNSVLL